MKKINIIISLFIAMLAYSNANANTSSEFSVGADKDGKSIGIGFENNVGGAQSNAIGLNNTLEAAGTTILGRNNVVSNKGESSTILGNGNVVSKYWVNVIGNGNVVSGENSKIVGRKNTVNSNEVFILGNEITANVEEAIYLGKGATAEIDKTERSAGNTNYSSQDVTITNGSISKTLSLTFAGASEKTRLITIGSEGKERRIQNVAPGLISDKSTDAINGSQLYAAINQFAGDINGLGNNVNIATSGVASTAAMANLPQVSNISGHRHNIAGAYGYYNREHAFALGLSGLNETGNIVYKATGALNTRGYVALGAGIGYQFDKLESRRKDILTLQRNGNINLLDEKVYELDNKVEKLENKVAELEQILQKVLKK